MKTTHSKMVAISRKLIEALKMTSGSTVVLFPPDLPGGNGVADIELSSDDFESAEFLISEAMILCSQVSDEDLGIKVDAEGNPLS